MLLLAHREYLMQEDESRGSWHTQQSLFLCYAMNKRTSPEKKQWFIGEGGRQPRT
jgi:hypothetical protein